jgi:hypothetical protein
VERATLEGMIKSHDELLMEMAKEYGRNRMGESDDDDQGNDAAPPASAPPATAPKEIEMVPE